VRIHGLPKHLVWLVEDRDLRIRLARAGQAQMEEFTWQRSTDLLETRLEQLVRNRRDR
jgi:hypothetical protein